MTERDANPESERQLVVITVITLGLVAVGLPFVVQYWLLDVRWMSAAVGLTLVGGTLNLLWARSTGRVQEAGVIGAVLLLGLLLASNVASGGFYDPNMGWLYVLPVLAALLSGSRSGWLFTGLVLVAVVMFWVLEEVLGVSLPSLVSPEDHALQSLANRVSAVVALGIGLAALMGRDRDRRERLAAINKQLRREMAERERVHEQLVRTQQLATLGELAASVGHEVNNPLTYVLGNLALLRERVDHVDPDQREESRALLVEAIDGAHRVREIVGNLKALSREPSTEPSTVVSLADVWRRAAVLSATHAYLDVQVDDLPDVLAREGPLVQIAVNLLTNATHALDGRPGAAIEVRGGTSDQAVWVEVRDNGPGIPPELAERVFEPFFTTRAGVGTGLGLPICRSLAVDMGGELAFVAPQTGAVFRLTLPRAVPSPTPTASEPRRLRLLVVDDDPLVLKAVGRSLTGHDVTLAQGADAALERWQEQTYDCVVCDVMMPGLNGPQLIERLEQQTPGAGTRVVFISGAVLGRDVRRTLREAGIQALAKPVDAQQLRQAVSAAARRVG